MCARLLGVSAHALNSNPGLILLVVVTKIVLTLAILPMFAFMFLAYTNGHIGRNGALLTPLLQSHVLLVCSN